MPKESRRGCCIPWNRSYSSCGSPDMGTGINPGPLEKQHKLLTIESCVLSLRLTSRKEFQRGC